MNSFESTSVAADGSLSMTIIDLVARTDDADPVALDPLYNAIDPDLLDSLPDSDGFTSLEFSYHGYTVTVEDGADGVEVTLADAAVSTDGAGTDLVDTSSST
ncbi:HalOD1 output domain-containing protein [Natrinema sp. 74]|uniref:HalOD1 output domain-containing protein n=1 Tax=Natrinema sp. 74 TaxID=3384159 RepID=UPI0038D40F18